MQRRRRCLPDPQDLAVGRTLAGRRDRPAKREIRARNFIRKEQFPFTVPFGIYLCVVDIDHGTGETKIRRFHALDDCGARINPMIIDSLRDLADAAQHLR